VLLQATSLLSSPRSFQGSRACISHFFNQLTSLISDKGNCCPDVQGRSCSRFSGIYSSFKPWLIVSLQFLLLVFLVFFWLSVLPFQLSLFHFGCWLFCVLSLPLQSSSWFRLVSLVVPVVDCWEATQGQ
jgi:hypothetical protein